MTSAGLNGNGHIQEATVVSLSGTIVEQQNASPTLESYQFTDLLPPSASPGLLSPFDKPPPLRREKTIDTRALPAVIPPDHAGRTLIVCFDGTGDQFDADNSNIVQLVSLLKKDDRTKQLVYYQAGIGTYTSPKIATPLMSRMRKTLDEMFAWNIHAHVMSGYEFLMQHYITGDKICLFGFSRGAYTARSLAGMLHKVGLLPAGNFQQVPFAYKMYARTDHVGWEQSNEFKKAFSVDVPIEFVGVWDTVDSVGIIPKRLPFTTSNTIVKTFRHAVALDERRAKFKANLWNRPNVIESKLGRDGAPNTLPSDTNRTAGGFPLARQHTNDDPVPKPGKNGKNGKNGNPNKKPTTRKESEDEKVLNTLERMYSEKNVEMTDIEEVWFAGCHCDVGGGAVSNKTRHSLARITLRWMVRECFKTNTGIMFKSDALRDIGLDPTTLYPFVTPRPPPLPVGSHRLQDPPAKPIPIKPHAMLMKKKSIPDITRLLEASKIPFLGTEEEEELKDAMSPKYDQLKIKKSWWVLEILPMQLRYQRGDNEWVTYFGSNLARPRFIPKQRSNGFKVHRSVKLRMDAEYENEKARQKGKKYQPKPHWRVEPTWID
ncbi:hypothetical protein B0H34DRAFT_431646 [Crassisporium funariophilum]|nr:hypothetical protein B0H34DRAFT_431646 [Crassisporium funariophilum]